MKKKLWLLVLTTLLAGPLAADLDQSVYADDPPIWDGNATGQGGCTNGTSGGTCNTSVGPTCGTPTGKPTGTACDTPTGTTDSTTDTPATIGVASLTEV